jgi:hypothetical protein
MKMSIKKRLVLGAAAIATVGAAATLVAGVTFGLFSATPQSQTNNFTAGTVSLGSTATSTCVVPPYIVPGDSGTCVFSATYTGNVSAFIGLTTSTTGTLYTGDGTDNADHLVVTITDNATVPNTYSNNGTDLYVSTDGSGAAAHVFTVTWSLPKTADNGYQGTSAAVVLTVSAVQSANNGSCPTVTAVCSGTAWI